MGALVSPGEKDKMEEFVANVFMVAKNVEEEISKNQFQGDLPAPDVTMQLDANKQIDNVLNEARNPERQKLERELEDVK